MTQVVVIDSEGQQARLASPISEEADHVFLVFGEGERLSVPADLLEQQEDGTFRLGVAFSALREGVEIVLPIVEEQLTLDKRVRETGRVRLHKIVETRQETLDEPLLREEVEIERVPVGEYVNAPVAIRQEGDVTVIPVLEEVLVVEKRLRLREELRVTKRQTEIRDVQDITLRSERIEVERVVSTTEPETGKGSRL